MPTIFCPKEDTLETIVEKIRTAQEDALTLNVEKGSLYWQNPANAQILQRLAEKYGKTVSIEHRTDDQNTHVAEPVDTDEHVEANPNPEPKKEKSKKKSKLGAWFRFPRVLIILALFLIVGVGSASAYVFYYLPRADVALLVSKKTLKKDVTVVLQPEQEKVDVTSKSIPVSVETAEVEQTKEFDATGTKTIGDKATGTITVYNWTDARVTLDIGQVFTVNADQEGAGFKFLATEPVSVDWVTEETTTDENGIPQKTTVPGTASVPVEAEDVGAIYNLPAELFFTVQGYTYSDEGLQGYNAQLFSGGNTEEVTVVSEEDIANAFESLKSDLEPKAKDQLEAMQNGKRLVTEYVPIAIVNNAADKEAGDEAKKFSAASKLKATGYLYEQNDIKTLFESLFVDDIPSGFKLAADEMSVSVSYVGLTEEGFIQVSATGEVLLIPQIDTRTLKNDIAGKTPQEAQAIIAKLEHVSEGTIEIRPHLPSSLQRLPFKPERITITIQEE